MSTTEKTMTTDNGMVVTTALSNREAYDILAQTDPARLNDFVLGLLEDFRKFADRMTVNKLAWMHRYAIEVADREVAGDYDSRIELKKAYGNGQQQSGRTVRSRRYR